MKYAIFLDHLLCAEKQSGRPLESLLAKARELGFEAVECDWTQLAQERLARALREAGLGVSGVYAFLDYRQDTKDECSRLLDLARQVEAGCVMPLPVLLREGEDRTALRRVMADGIAQVCEEAEAMGLRVVLEDFDSPRAPFGRLEELCWFLREIPALGCAFDTGNFLIHGQDVLAAYAPLRPRIRHVHLKDRLDSPRWGDDETPDCAGKVWYPAPAGSGLLPSGKILDRLEADGYDGWCVLEHFGACDQLDCMRREAEWLRARRA